MTTVFDKSTREELIRRINTVDETNTARWGRMNVYQMLRHCTLWEAWIQRKSTPHLQADTHRTRVRQDGAERHDEGRRVAGAEHPHDQSVQDH